MMMENKVYIRSTGIISPQANFGKKEDFALASEYTGSSLHCIEPDYKSILDPKLIRRMSRIIRMGAAAALECMVHSEVQQPDGIITGTAYGCVEDTVSFLTKMVENKEELLTPTAFIQSTHNTVGSQIALLLKCHQYNNTFVQRGFSFEHALMDALLLLNENEAKTILVGGIDELNETSEAILKRFGLYRTNQNNLQLLTTSGKGSMAGEGASFFLLSSESSSGNIACLDDLKMLFDPNEETDVVQWIHYCLSENNLTWEQIDLVITGRNGNQQGDLIYDKLEFSIAKKTRFAYFKHLCGEYPTASSFGMWMAISSIRENKIPFTVTSKTQSGTIRKVLLYNHDQNGHHSLMLFSAC